MGALNLETMNVSVSEFETINGDAIVDYFEQIRKAYPHAPRIHIILDRGPYHTCKLAQEAAEKHNIALHYLPPYSPNLNPIERVWKIMNEYARNNVVFKTVREFKDAVMGFFNKTWPKISLSMVGRVNDDFQRLKPAS